MEYHLIVFNNIGHSSYFGRYLSKEEAEKDGLEYADSYMIIYGEDVS